MKHAALFLTTVLSLATLSPAQENTMEKTTPTNDAKILQGIPAMHYGNPSAVCYIGAVMRLMEHVNDPVPQDELFALSGVGLCFPWAFASDCDEVSLVPEIPARLFAALGYESKHLTGDVLRDKQACLYEIKASIDAGRPVIGFGITTKSPYACLIVGYDANGLYTRSFHPPKGEPHDSEKYFYSTDWHENCAGLQFVGQKIEERLAGMQAHEHIIMWARNFRWERKNNGFAQPTQPDGKEIFLNEQAFNKMIEWLLDDAQWENPSEGGKEQFLKQCGLLLFDHYRWQLLSYLKKLDAKYPGIVNPPVFEALARVGRAIPGAAKSDLWLHEAVDPALADFANMRARAMREKVAGYVRRLQGYDNSIQWTLFMPPSVKHRISGDFIRNNFEYRDIGKVRFIGKDLERTGEKADDMWAREDFLAALDALMPEHASGIKDNCLLVHHNGREWNEEVHPLAGRFFKADTPVPEGFDFYDVPTVRAGYAIYHSENFNGEYFNPAYEITRDQILGDGVVIPYPEAYWTAEVYLNGRVKEGPHRFGYLFSVGEWE